MDYDDAQNPISNLVTEYQHVSSTIGLFTHDNGDYSLIDVQDTKVRAAGITFTDAGKKLLDEYKARYTSGSEKPGTIGATNEQLVFESYLMSQAIHYSSWIDIGTYDAPIEDGSFAYGWHFNWNGSRAAVVTYDGQWEYGGNENTVYATKQVLKLYVVSINETVDPITGIGDLSSSIELQEESEAQINGGELRVWSPTNDNRNVMGVEPIIYCSTLTHSDYGKGAFDIPLYCFYKPDGSLRVIRFFREVISTMTYAEAFEQASLGDCPDLGWDSNSPGTLESHYEQATEASRMGFRVDELEATADSGGGFYRTRQHVRTLNGDGSCGNRGWQGANLSSWTRTEYVLDCSVVKDCGYSGPLFWSDHINVDYTEYESTTGGPNLGEKTNAFALMICGRSSDSVAMATSQRTYKRMKFDHQQLWAYDWVEQRNRITEDGFFTCGTIVRVPRAGFWMPSGGCEASSTFRAVPDGHGGDRAPRELWVEDSTEYVTKAYIANPYESKQTDEIVGDSSASQGNYEPYFHPRICNNIPAENMWFDVNSYTGRSLRTESADNPSGESNCEFQIDLPGGSAFFNGWD